MMPRFGARPPVTPDMERLIEAALPNVAFDGWSAATRDEAARAAGLVLDDARRLFPRGGVDMAIAFHRMMDDRLATELAATDLEQMRIRDRVTHCVRRRIELVAFDREAVRRGATLFALPQYAPDGLAALWQTADVIWTACGDTSRDYNWYTKRLILSGVYSSTVLYWLGDQDPGFHPTWDFLDRRIADVMAFEKAKAQFTGNPLSQMAQKASGMVERMREAGRAEGPRGRF